MTGKGNFMIEVKNLVKEYSTKGGQTVRALDNVSVQFAQTGMVFLLGKSGSGKSTLLNILGGLDKPDEGEIIVKGKSSKQFSTSDFDSYRNTFVGFVFQEYNILNEFTVEQNIALALQLQSKSADKKTIEELLTKVDMSGLGKRKPNTLSGGQKQRVAIARALIKEPEIIMADEPTGALDSNTGKQVFQTLKKLSETKLVIVVSHDIEFAELYGDRIIELKDGKIISDVTKTEIKPQQLNANVKIVSNDMISISDAENITEDDVKSIVSMLKNNGGEAIITTGTKDIADIKRVCKINESGNKESFEKTEKVEVKEYQANRVKFIKSRMPAFRAIKMGASGLKTKPIRFVFTILLSVVAFIMFGVVSTFMLYDKNYSISEALKSENAPRLTINKIYSYKNCEYVLNLRTGYKKYEASYGERSSTLFGVQEMQEKNRTGVSNYAGIFDFTDRNYNDGQIQLKLRKDNQEIDINISSQLQNYFVEGNVCGFSDCGAQYMSDNGFELICGQYPQNKTEIAIPEYVANLFVNTANSGINSVSEMEGKTIRIIAKNNSTLGNFVVSGVYNVGKIPSKYEVLKDDSNELNLVEKQKLIDSLHAYLKLSYNTIIYVSNDFYDAYKNNIVRSYEQNIPNRYLNLVFSKTETSTQQIGTTNVLLESVASFYSDFLNFFDKQGNPIDFAIEDNQVFVSRSVDINDICYYANGRGEKGQLEVVGYFETTPNAKVSCDYIISDNFYKDHVPDSWLDSMWLSRYESDYEKPIDAKYNYLITLTNNTQEQVANAIKSGSNVSYQIQSDSYMVISQFAKTMNNFKKLFMIIGIVFAVFSALMLLNFISVSISAKRKDIGILRAVGARGIDVFKIFFAEAIIIAIICFILASVGAFFTCGLLNDSLFTLTSVKMLNFQPINAIFILCISLIVCVFATFMPVYFEAKKSPVESIRNN